MIIKCTKCNSEEISKLRLEPTVYRCFECKTQFLEEDAIAKQTEVLAKDKKNKVIIEKKYTKKR